MALLNFEEHHLDKDMQRAQLQIHSRLKVFDISKRSEGYIARTIPNNLVKDNPFATLEEAKQALEEAAVSELQNSLDVLNRLSFKFGYTTAIEVRQAVSTLRDALHKVKRDKSKEELSDKQHLVNKIAALCNGHEYDGNVPDEAKKLAALHNCIIVVGYSDDLAEFYGADCALTRQQEIGCWEGADFSDLTCIKDGQSNYFMELKKLSLKVLWCGKIEGKVIIENYDVQENGGFFFQVQKDLITADFKIMEADEVYCTGKVIALPDDFKTNQ